MTAKPAPSDLQKRGRATWRAVFGRYELNPVEELLLHELCRIADVLDRLAGELANDVTAGGVSELEKLLKTAVLLSRRLALPDDLAARQRTWSAEKAANTRWKGAS
jgi:hypothetical protein